MGKAKNAARKREYELRRHLDILVGEIILSKDAKAVGAQDVDMQEEYTSKTPSRRADHGHTVLAASTSSSSRPAPPPPSATLPAFSDADLALLRHEFASDVSLLDLDSLDPVQLAVAALRPDLDSLVQRRAYHDFLQRREEYEQGFGADVPEPIFSVPLNFPIPADISTLGPAYLLLVQFNPLCLSGAEATAASARFFELARQARTGTAAELPPALLAPAVHHPVDTALDLATPAPPPPVERAGDDSAVLAKVAIDRCVASSRGVGSTPSASLVLHVKHDGLDVASGAGKHLFTIEPAQVREYTYYPPIPAEGNDLTASAPTIVIDLKRVLVPTSVPWRGKKTTLRIESAQLCEPDAAFEVLRARSGAWAAEFGFEAWSSSDRPPDDAAVTARTALVAGAAAATETSGTPAPPTDLVMADLMPPPPPADSHPPAAPILSTSTSTALPPAVALPPAAPEPAPASTSTRPRSTSPSRAPSSYVELPVERCVVVHTSGRQDALEGLLVVRVQAHGLVVLPLQGFMWRLEAAQMDEVEYINAPSLEGAPSRTTLAVSLAELVTSATITYRSVVVQLEVDITGRPAAWHDLCEAVAAWSTDFGFETKETLVSSSSPPAAPAPVETPSTDVAMADLALAPPPADPQASTPAVASTTAPITIPASLPARSSSPDSASSSSSADPPSASRPSRSPSVVYAEVQAERGVIVYKDGHEELFEGPLAVREVGGALVVVPREGSELRLEASQMDEVDYVDSPGPDGPSSRTTVVISLAELAMSASVTHRSVVVRLEIDSERDADAWQGLCETVAMMASRFGFEVKENGNDEEGSEESPAPAAPVELPSAVLPTVTDPASSATTPPPPPPQPQPSALPRPSPSPPHAAQAPRASRLPASLPSRPPRGATPASPGPDEVAVSRMSLPRPPSPARPPVTTRPRHSGESGTPPLPHEERGRAPSRNLLKRSPSPPFRRDAPPLPPPPHPPRRRSPSPHRRHDSPPDRRRTRSPVRGRDSFDSSRRPPSPPRRSFSPHRRPYSPPDRRRSRSPVRRRDPFDSPPRRERSRSPPQRERSPPPPRRRSRSPEPPRYAPRRTLSPDRRGADPRSGRRDERGSERSPPPRRRSGYTPSPERARSSAGSGRDERYADSVVEPKWRARKWWTR